MKKALSVILCLCMVLSVFAIVPFNATAAENEITETGATSGTTGDCTWTLNGTELTISGNGAMVNYSYGINSSPPWTKSITKVTIAEGVTSIGDSAFSYCSSLTSVTIPDSVTSIGWTAFYGCTGLTSVTIPDSVTSIGNSAFNNTAWYNNQPDGLIYIGKFAYKMKGTCPSEVVIKDGTLGIAGGAFYDCNSLTSITIPDSVTSIGDYAFSDCTSLTSVIIGNSVTSIGEWAFYDCTSLTSVTIGNSVTSIGNYTFYGCSNLTSLTIPDSVTSIGYYAFRGCRSLTSVTIPDSVTSISNYAFSNCESLIIFGYIGSEAERYANKNSLTFIPFIIMGDVDYNGKVEINDATWILRHLGSIKMPITIHKETSDIDGDGIITVMDATAIQYYLANMKTPYKIGEKIE